MNPRRALTAILALVVFGSPLTATEAPTRVVFYPGWFASAQFAGVFVALESGLYTEAGLTVEIRDFSYGQDSTANLQADPETCAMGSIEGYILLQKLDRGDDLIAFAPMLQQSPAGVMSLTKSGVHSAADFAHRPVGVHAYADALFAWFARNAGLAPDATQFVRVEDDIAALLTGEIDAMQGYASEEFVRLRAAAAPQPVNFLSFAELGFPSYSEILYTTREQATTHAETVATFVEATRQGWRRAYEDPVAAVTAIVKHAGPDADPAHIAAALRELRPYVMGPDDSPLPTMDHPRWQQLQATALEMGLIKTPSPDPTTWLAR
ncbi:ABC transporter substrate-binding protein [Synoicihabitans lomoniglobus]|uniref:Thiamine pyrimidine synthase n=1 Tax=Synoicihabitans lomoniglobus TaxID=2909285 RepID=A0AAF0CRA6_9BACT|nr:ABC transporter substrate-binding protein [Opitutaceae bacterium LMO-M01]WED66611.1 ABC transporter substrate-binding protein [Opitutaceae bacterium LMO-M01]